MKTNQLILLLLLVVSFPVFSHAQEHTASPVKALFPEGTTVFENVPYAGDTLQRHLMDVYLPQHASGKLPLVVFIHGGAWMMNSKYSDMNYMANTVKGFIDSGYALASIDYRYSTEAVFPAQIQDCNRAINYLYQHAQEYHIDRTKIALIGFSAGGHLASLLALSNNNAVKEFYPSGVAPLFHISCVMDFYGPSDLMILMADTDTSVNNKEHPIAMLLGALPLERPDLARRASPVTYIDKNDPPFFIVQGEKDMSVPYTQSVLLGSWLKLADVKHELTIVKHAPHYGVMFDTEDIRTRLFRFLKMNTR